MELVYKYSFGNEDVRSEIMVFKTGTDSYQIHFYQEGFDSNHFKKIKTSFEELSRSIKTEKEFVGDELSMPIVKTIVIKIKAVCDPPPETLFTLY